MGLMWFGNNGGALRFAKSELEKLEDEDMQVQKTEYLLRPK